jgi:iron complex transport system substrate-binding protein
MSSRSFTSFLRAAPAMLAGTALTVSLAACGASSTSTSSDAAAPVSIPAAASAASGARTSYPLTINNCGWKVTFKAAPSRVLILNGTSVGEAETFVLLGLQDKVVANAQSYGVSDDPTMIAKVAALPKGNLSMNKNFDVPAEQVLALKPDLVVSTWAGGFDAQSGFATRDQLAQAGAASLVNPVNCAFGDPAASAEDKTVMANEGVHSSMEFITLLGQVFDVQGRAAALTQQLQARIDAVRAKVAGKPTKNVLVVYPGLSMTNASGLPRVMAGGIYDDIIKSAGGLNPFAGKGPEFTRTLNAEQLAATKVDVLVVAALTPQEKPADEAAKIFANYPQWEASKTKAFATVSDGMYLGPLNALAIEKIAKAAHPDAF